MSNSVRFLYDFTFDGAAVASSGEVAGLPAANVLDCFVKRVWRSTGVSGQWITFDCGAPAHITMLAMFGHNLTVGATIQLQGNNADSWSSPGFSMTVARGAGPAVAAFLDRTYRYWRIVVDDAANPDGYIEIGRITSGVYYEPSVNIGEDAGKRLIDPSILMESDGRQSYAIEREHYRVYSVSFTAIDRAQQDELERMFRAVGTVRPFVFALDPENKASEDTIYCTMTTPLEHALGGLGYGDVALVLEEKVG